MEGKCKRCKVDLPELLRFSTETMRLKKMMRKKLRFTIETAAGRHEGRRRQMAVAGSGRLWSVMVGYGRTGPTLGSAITCC